MHQIQDSIQLLAGSTANYLTGIKLGAKSINSDSADHDSDISAPRFGSGPVRFEFGPGSNRTRTLDFTNFKLRTGLELNYKFGPGSVRSLQTSLSPNMLLSNRTESNFKLSSPKFEKVRKVFLWFSSLYSQQLDSKCIQ